MSTDEHRRRYTAVNIAVGFINSFFVGGEGGDASGICRLNDSVEVERRRGLTVRVVAEIWKVERHTAVHSTDTGHELADFSLELHGIDMDDIVGTGMAGAHARYKTQLVMEAVNTALGEIHPADRTGREEQTRIVNVNDAIFIDKALLVKNGKLVVLNMPVAVGLTGESTLDGGAEDRGSVLHSLEEGSLSKLGLRLAIVDLCWTATTESLAEAGVEDTVADGAGLLYDG